MVSNICAQSEGSVDRCINGLLVSVRQTQRRRRIHARSVCARELTNVLLALPVCGPSSPLCSLLTVVIVSALRTPITKAKKGGLSQCAPEEMLGWTIKGVLAESKIDPKLIQDVAVGTVLAPGGGSTQARMGALWAGIPNTAGCNSLNRQCSSGLAAVNQIANQIALGQIDIGIGESSPSM